MSQVVLTGENAFARIAEEFKNKGVKKALVVCAPFFEQLKIASEIKALGVDIVKFTDFTPNPTILQVIEGIKVFRQNSCDVIIAVGGGSAIDTAKCIKLYCKEDINAHLLELEHRDSGVILVAIPTTAGTGSESTRFAVVYENGVKQSVTDTLIVPDIAVLDGELLSGLPLYQKKCTLLDAFCQAIESYWSVNSTSESKKFTKEALKRILAYGEEYLNGNTAVNDEIMLGANFAGKAINITQTTGAHAMSYKITSIYDLPHGHAVAVCLPVLWEYMIENTEDCVDERGGEYLRKVFAELASLLGEKTPIDAVEKIKRALKSIGISGPNISKDRIDELAKSVNATRLKNNPVRLTEVTLKELYERVSKI